MKRGRIFSPPSFLSGYTNLTCTFPIVIIPLDLFKEAGLSISLIDKIVADLQVFIKSDVNI